MACKAWQVSDLPLGITDADEREITWAFHAAKVLKTPGAADDGGPCGYYTHLRARGASAAAPYAFVMAEDATAKAAEEGDEDDDSDAGVLQSGIIVRGTVCTVTRRRAAQRTRRVTGAMHAEKAARDAAARLARRPAWRPELLDRFPRRETTLCQKTMVASLPPALLAHVTAYLAQREKCCPGMGAALAWVWRAHPKALRVKELFETVETLALLVSQLKQLQALHKKSGSGGRQRVRRVFDLACGHGLLGVLLARRFPDVEVVCVDLVRRDGFDRFCEAFRATTTPGGAAAAAAAAAAPAAVAVAAAQRGRGGGGGGTAAAGRVVAGAPVLDRAALLGGKRSGCSKMVLVGLLGEKAVHNGRRCEVVSFAPAGGSSRAHRPPSEYMVRLLGVGGKGEVSLAVGSHNLDDIVEAVAVEAAEAAAPPRPPAKAAPEGCARLEPPAGGSTGSRSPVLPNLLFVEGDIAAVELEPAGLDGADFVACVHGCNEVNVTAAELAKGAGAGFMAVPCCIREGLYLDSVSHRIDHDDTRHALAVGAFAAATGAHSVSAIDRRITNRHLVVFGGYPKLNV